MTLRRIASLPVGSPILGLSKAGVRGKNVAQGHASILYHHEQSARSCRFFLYKKGKKWSSTVSWLTDAASWKWLTCFMSLVVGSSYASAVICPYLVPIKINLIKVSVISHEHKTHYNGISQTTNVLKVRHVLKYLVESGLLLSSFSTENTLGKKIKGFFSVFGERIGEASFLTNK